MNVSVTYRDSIDQSDSLESRLERRLEKIDQKLHQSATYKVVFARDGHDYRVQITFQVDRQDIVAEGEADDPYKGIDQAADRAERQVRRVHDKRSSHSSS